MNETPEPIDEELELSNLSQALLIELMIRRGIIRVYEDFANDGYAETFDMLAWGRIKVKETFAEDV